MRLTINLLFFLLLLTSFSAQAQRWRNSSQQRVEIDYTNPQQYVIGDITVSGVEYLNPQDIINRTGLKQGDIITIPGDEISKAIKRLWDQGLVGDVSVTITRIEGKVVYLNFELKERPRLSSYHYDGVRKPEKEDLEEKIAIGKGRIVTDALINNAERRIKTYYQEKGYLNAEVKINTQADTTVENGVTLMVTVDRKEKVRIRHIYITGNSAMSDKRVTTRMKKTKDASFMHALANKKLDLKEYKNDKQLIIDYYNSQGYRDMQIVYDSIIHVDETHVDLEINISEGGRYYFRNIFWTGNNIYSDRQLSDILNIRKGDVYNAELLQRRLNFNPSGLDISSLYLDNGYLFFNVDPVEVLIENDSIDIEMRMYEGGQATINRITISGNTKTHDHVIMREIRTLPGEKFSRADLIRTQRELGTIGYFDPEQIGINPIPNPQTETVDIHYSVVEKPSDQIQLSGGWGGNFGFVGTVGLVFNNFSLRNIKNPKTWSPMPSGDGQRLALNVQANGRSFQTYSLTFTEPWLGGKRPTSFSVSLQSSFQSRLDYNYSPPRVLGRFNLSGITVSIGKRLKWPDDFFSVMHSFSFMHYTLNNWTAFTTVPDFPTTGTANKIAYSMTITRNNLDDFTFPGKGASISFNMTLTPPYSRFNGVNYDDPNLSPETKYKWIEYNKWMLDIDYYATVIPGKKRKLVLKTKMNFGFLNAYSNQTAISVFDRFKLGGSGLSGFNFLLGYDIIGLRGYPDNILPYSGTPGVVYDKFAFELRYPVMNSPALSLFVHSFFEAGNAWDNYKDYNPFNTYRAAGFGTRIFMPAFGLIGIDWGVPLDEVPGYPNPHHKPRVTFSIGQQIR